MSDFKHFKTTQSNPESNGDAPKLIKQSKIKPIINSHQTIYNSSWRKKNIRSTRIAFEVDTTKSNPSSFPEKAAKAFFKRTKHLTTIRKAQLCFVLNEPSNKFCQNLKRLLKKSSSLENLSMNFEGARKLFPMPEIQHLKRLKSLNLSFPRFLEVTDQELLTLTESCRRLRQVERLSLRTNNSKITEQGLAQFSNLFQQLKHLSHFSFQSWNERSNFAKSSRNNFLKSLHELPCLTSLNVSFGEKENSFGADEEEGEEEEIPFVGFKTLECLHLKLEGTAGFNRLSELQSLQILRYLSLDCTMESDDEMTAMTESLQLLTQLRTLAIKLFLWQDISDEGIVLFGQYLAAQQNLEEIHIKLDLSQGGELPGLYTFLECLARVQNIKSFVIESWADHGYDTPMQILNYLHPLTSLEKLVVISDPMLEMDPTGLEVLCQNLPSFLHLHTLSLTFNESISAQAFRVFSDQLIHLPRLRNLRLTLESLPEIKDLDLVILGRFLGASRILTNLSLNFSGCDNISSAGIEFLTKQIVSSRSLKIIDFFNNQSYFDQKMKESLQTSFENMQGIQAHRVNGGLYSFEYKGHQFLCFPDVFE